MTPDQHRHIIDTAKALTENRRWTKQDEQREAMQKAYRHWPWVVPTTINGWTVSSFGPGDIAFYDDPEHGRLWFHYDEGVTS